MLTQALRKDGNRRLMAVCNCDSEKNRPQKIKEICRKLDINDSASKQVDVQLGTAKQFFETKDLAATLTANLPADNGAPF